MSSDWPTVRLGDLTKKITKGTTPKAFVSNSAAGRINFIKVETISPDGRFIPSKFASIDAETNTALARSILQEDDLLFTIAGTIGRVARVRKQHLPANTNQAVAIVRADPQRVDIGYLSCVLGDRVRVQQAQSRVVQSVQANFSLGELADLEIPLPPLAEQRRIAGALGALDDLIEVNRGLIQDIEEIAKTIFTQANQTNSTRARLGDVATVSSGKFLEKKSRGVGVIPVIGSNGQIGTTDRATEPGPVVVVGRVGACGQVALTDGPAWISDNALVVKPRDGQEPAVLYWLMKSLDFAPLVQGTTQPMIRGSDVSDQIVLVPNDLRIQNSLAEFCVAQRSLATESLQLAATRDELLPLLMSGRVRVPEVVAV